VAGTLGAVGLRRAAAAGQTDTIESIPTARLNVDSNEPATAVHGPTDLVVLADQSAARFATVREKQTDDASPVGGQRADRAATWFTAKRKRGRAAACPAIHAEAGRTDSDCRTATRGSCRSDQHHSEPPRWRQKCVCEPYRAPHPGCVTALGRRDRRSYVLANRCARFLVATWDTGYLRVHAILR